MKQQEAGYTLVELLVCIAVLSVLSFSGFQLFTSLLHSSIISQRQAVASTLATNRMEYLKSLPYDNLAVAGGAIVSTVTVPKTTTQKVQGMTYTITNTITYADDAYDGCGSYPSTALKTQYCRSYPPPSGAPTTDLNAGDYKNIRVSVTDTSGTELAVLDTQAAALVAETASNTGALFVRVQTDAGDPISGATINVVNPGRPTAPACAAVNVTDSSDVNGMAIFYNLPPCTTGYLYTITGSLAGYSTLSTIPQSGSLVPNYSSQNLITQSSSSVTLTLRPQASNSLILETTDTNGAVLGNVNVHMKGGYKKYTSASNAEYYYEVLNANRINTNTTTGLAAVNNLVPGPYYFCDNTSTANRCIIGSGTTAYYVAAAVPYGGENPLQPITVPVNSTPLGPTFTYNTSEYLQKVRLMLTSSSTFPRVASLTPSGVAEDASNLNNFGFTLTGANLSSAQVRFIKGATTYTATCSGDSTTLNCTVNLTGITAGVASLRVTVGSNTLNLPSEPLLGGLIVTP